MTALGLDALGQRPQQQRQHEQLGPQGRRVGREPLTLCQRVALPGRSQMLRGLPNGPRKSPKRIGAKWAPSAPAYRCAEIEPRTVSRTRGEGRAGPGPVGIPRRAPRYQYCERAPAWVARTGITSILIYVKRSHPQTVPRGPKKTPVGVSVILFGTQADGQIHWDSNVPRVSCCMARIELLPPKSTCVPARPPWMPEHEYEHGAG